MDHLVDDDVLNAGVRPGETPQAFAARAARIYHEAVDLSRQISGSYHEMNKWMVVADRLGLRVVPGWVFAIRCMKAQFAGENGRPD
jgi:hypothetical protein